MSLLALVVYNVGQPEMRRPTTASPTIILAVAACAVALAACGSSTKSTSTAAAGPSPQGIRYADCMRSHRVPNFPDPSANGGVQLPPSINPESPGFQSASQACASEQPNANGPRPKITAAQQKSFVANAKCMRRHGIPNFPDPVFGPSGEGIGYDVSPGAFSGEPQAILQASRACIHVGTPLPLGGLVRGG